MRFDDPEKLPLCHLKGHRDSTSYMNITVIGQFPARALPSAGLLPFVQSFMCSVNNECMEMDQFEEIPSYSKAKLVFNFLY